MGRDEVRGPCRRRGALAGSRSGSVPLTFAPVVGRHLAAAFISSLPSGAPATAPRGGIWPLCPGRRCGRPASPAESSRWCRGDGASPVRRRLQVQVSEGVTAARLLGCPVVSTGARRCPSALGEPNVDAAEEREEGGTRPAGPARPAAGPAWRRPFRCRSHFVFFPPRPAPEVPTDPGPRGMARPGGPRSLPRSGRRTRLLGNFHPGCPDREALTVHRPRVWTGRWSPARVRARVGRCRRARLSGVPFRGWGPGPGPARRARRIGTGAPAGPGRPARPFLPRFPASGDRAADRVAWAVGAPFVGGAPVVRFPSRPLPESRFGGAVVRGGPCPRLRTVAGGSVSSPRLSSGLPGLGGRPGGPAAPPARGDGVVIVVPWPEPSSEEAAEVRGSAPPTDAVIFPPESDILCHQRGVDALSSGDGPGWGPGPSARARVVPYGALYPAARCPGSCLWCVSRLLGLRAGSRVIQASRRMAVDDPSGLWHPRGAEGGQALRVLSPRAPSSPCRHTGAVRGPRCPRSAAGRRLPPRGAGRQLEPRGKGVCGEAEAGSSDRCPRCATFLRPFSRCVPIDVVTSRSPGPGLSRARRGTDIHGEWDRSSRSACGPLASPTRPMAVCGRQGCGLRPDPVHPASCLTAPAGPGVS